MGRLLAPARLTGCDTGRSAARSWGTPIAGRGRLAIWVASFFVDEFPLTGSGKVQKFVLRERWEKGEFAPKKRSER